MITNGDLSQATVSGYANVDKPNVTVQATVSSASTLTNTFKIQCTSSPDLANAVWDDIPGSSVAITADGTTTWNLSGVGYNGIKFLATKSGGSGLVQVTVSQN